MPSITMAPHHFLWLLLLQQFCFADNELSGGEIGCSLPPVKKGETATLTCSYNFKLTAGVTVTVNGQGLHIGGSDKGKDVPVLSLDYTKEGWENQIVHPRFQLRHISNVTDGMKWTVVIDILNATEEYEGLYTCQLLLQFGSGAPGPQQCNFFLDTLTTEIKNASSVLLRSPDHPIKKIELRKQDSEEVKTITVDPPKKSYPLHDMESNTAYVIKVHVDQMDYPLTRTVCLPAVRNLTTEAVNASTIRVHWETSSCHTVGTAFTYHVCHKKAASVEQLRCSPSNITTVLLSDLEAETDYQIRVSVSVGEKNVGSVTQRQSTSQDKTVHDSGEEKTSVWRIVGITLVAVFGCGLIVALAIVCVRKKLWTCFKRNPGAQPNPHEAVPLNEVDVEAPLPLEVQEEQATDVVVEQDGPDCADASIGGIQSAQEGPDEKYEQLKAERDETAEELNRSVRERQETEQKLKRKSLECQELQTQVKETEQKLISKSLEGQRLIAKIKSLEEKNKRVFEEAKTKCTDLKKEINHCKEETKRLEREKKELEEKLSEAEKENRELAVKEARSAERAAQLGISQKRERELMNEWIRDLKQDNERQNAQGLMKKNEELGACGGDYLKKPPPVSCSPALSDDNKPVGTESSDFAQTASPSSITPVPANDDTAAQTQEDRATDSSLSSFVKTRHNQKADTNSKNSFAMASPQTSTHAQDVQDSKRSGQ